MFKHINAADKVLLLFVAMTMMATVLFMAEGTILYDQPCELTVQKKEKRGNAYYLQVKLPDAEPKYLQTTQLRWESVDRGDLIPVTVYYGALSKRPIKVVER